jgi:hypothetical protein
VEEPSSDAALKDGANAVPFGGANLRKWMDESFAAACRLTGTEIVRGVAPNRYVESTESTRGPHDRKHVSLLKFLIFTAGNPPEGQQ